MHVFTLLAVVLPRQPLRIAYRALRSDDRRLRGTALEYLEIHNPDAATADLSGWALRSGVNYTFPAGTNIAAGGYLVVAANPAGMVDCTAPPMQLSSNVAASPPCAVPIRL